MLKLSTHVEQVSELCADDNAQKQLKPITHKLLHKRATRTKTSVHQTFDNAADDNTDDENTETTDFFSARSLTDANGWDLAAAAVDFCETKEDFCELTDRLRLIAS